MFNIQVVFNTDINCPPTLSIHHKILLHLKRNSYVQQRLGFVSLFICFVLALPLIWKKKDNLEFIGFCRFVMFRGDFLKQLRHPRINVIKRVCSTTHVEYKIIPLVDKNIVVNVRSCEVFCESKCNLAASILWEENCHFQGYSVVITDLFCVARTGIDVPRI